jgi:hypothetical protein
MRRLPAMDDELARLAVSLRQRRNLQAGAARLRAAVTEADAALRQAQAHLIAQRRALRRLTGFSPARLLAAAGGNSERVLSRKQVEVSTAADRVLGAQRNLAVLRGQLDELGRELTATSAVPAAYDAALNRKEQRLRPHSRLDELAHRRARLRAELRDLTETVNLADVAATALDQAGEALDATAGWSIADILGGGALISLIKDRELDDAAELAAQADHHLSVLRRRLTSMPPAAFAERLRVDAVARFADISLDNVLVDLAVHGQITDALDRIDSALCHLWDLRAGLIDRLTAARAELHRADAERHALLLR